MALHHPPTIILTTTARLSPAECQPQIDARSFLVPLRLLSLQPDGPDHASADLGGRRLEFTVERRSTAEVVDPGGLEAQDRWPYAYAFRGLGELDTSIAANMVALAVAAATGGALYNARSAFRQDFDAIQPSIEAVLAGMFNCDDLLAARYPDLAELTPKGPHDTVVTRIWMGNRVLGENVQRLKCARG